MCTQGHQLSRMTSKFYVCLSCFSGTIAVTDLWAPCSRGCSLNHSQMGWLSCNSHSLISTYTQHGVYTCMSRHTSEGCVYIFPTGPRVACPVSAFDCCIVTCPMKSSFPSLSQSHTVSSSLLWGTALLRMSNSNVWSQFGKRLALTFCSGSTKVDGAKGLTT